MTASEVLASSFSEASAELAERLRSILVTVRSPSGGGSGTAWSEDGLVVTNHHVVPGPEAAVILEDGSEHRATVEDRDPDHDLALLRVDARLAPAEPGDSAAVRPGILAFAIGNPWGQRGTLTSGIVLATGDAETENGVVLRDVIRADLRLAPGNSGGPMTDARGRVIGINSMIVGGMAVAVPVHAVQRFLAHVRPGEPGVLGVTLQPVRVPHAIAASLNVDDEAALMLTGVAPGSAAELAGLLPGDIVLASGEGRRGLRHLETPLRAMRAGSPVHLSVLRAGRLVDVSATPTARTA